MATTSITFEHPKGNDPSNEDDGELCEDTIEVELEFEPGEMYGSDADGNRGMWVGPSCSNTSDTPTECSECGHIYTDDERSEIEAKMNKAADDFIMEPDEPDYDDYYGMDD